MVVNSLEGNYTLYMNASEGRKTGQRDTHRVNSEVGNLLKVWSDYNLPWEMFSGKRNRQLATKIRK